MEKITSWLWRPEPGKPQREDSYFFQEEGGLVYVRRGDGTTDPGTLKATDMMLSYRARGYDKLQPHSQATYDFLAAKGY